ncbi:Berberine bridge enzyme-like 8 [Linum grandiflorum]
MASLTSAPPPNPTEQIYLKSLSDNSSTPIDQVIYFPTAKLYTSILKSNIRNLIFASDSTPRPLFIVAPTHLSHIQSTILCCKTHSLQLRIRSGGHDYDGLSYTSSVAVDLDSQTAWVDSGATVGEVYHQIAAKSRTHAFPGGVCPTVGVGGFLSGAGYGNLMRKYGLSVDNVLDAVVVDADARVLDRESMGEDFFWAINGGGGASFAVIASWKIRLVKVPENVTVFRVERTLEQGASDVVYKWQLIADKLPNDLFIRVVLIPVAKHVGGESSTVKAKFNAMFLGNRERLVGLMEEQFPELGLTRKDCLEMSWIESVLFWSNYPAGTSPEILLERHPKREKFLKRKSDYVQEPISKAGLEEIWKKMIELRRPVMALNPYGGKMGEIGEGESPFPHRAGNLYKIQYSVTWSEEGEEVMNENVDGIRSLYEFMTEFVSSSPRCSYLNYRDVEIGVDLDIGTGRPGKDSYAEGKVYGEKYFGVNFERLVKVKTAVDPSNFFWNEQSIPVLPSNVLTPNQ